MNNAFLIGVILFFGLLLSGCTKQTTENKNDNVSSESVEISNPASVYCKENQGIVRKMMDKDGGEYNLCVFNDGSSCEEWSYFRKECDKGRSLVKYNWKF